MRACNQFNDNTLNCGPATAIHQVTVLNLPTVVAAPSVPSQSLNGSYTLAWQQPSARVDYYRVLENGVLIAGVHNGLSLPLSARADGDYHYQVSACNSAGCSSYSPEASIRVLQTPSAVKHLQGDAVSNGAGAFQLHWQQPDRGQILRYEIRRNLAPNHTWATAINNGLALQRDFSQTEEGDYRYEVRACNALSCGSVQAHTVMVRIAPVSPSNINGIGVSTSGDYSLTWGSGSGTITAYELQQAKDELPAADDLDWQPLQRAHTTHYSVAGQTAGRYAYRVRACNDNNCGAWSALKVVEVDRHTVPLAPAPSAATAPQHPASSDTIGSTAGQFRISESGAATYTVPISVAAGTAGVAPELSLGYSSQGGNGLLGKGWTLGGLGSIVRCRQSAIQDGQAKAITWSSDDRYCLDGQRLVLVSGSHYGAVGSVYKTEIDTFAQITATGGSAGHPDYFVVSRKDGSTARFGASDDAKQQKGADRTYVWALNHFEDSVGNGIDFSYSNDADGHRIDSIRYAYGRGATAHAQVRFQYETRADILQAYVAGEHFVTRQRMVGIQTYSRHNGESVLLREYRLRYHSNEATGDHLDNADHRRDAALELSRLAGITECTDNAICLPETAFNWRAASTAFGIHSDASESGVLNFNGNNYLIDSKFTDINGDGLQDLVFVSGRVKLKKRFLRRPRLRSHQNVHYLMNTGSGFVHGDSTYYNDDIRNPLKLQVLDYNGDSHQDLLVYREQGGWELYLATASGGGHWSLEKTALTLPFSGRDIQLADLNADGLVDAFDGNRFWLLERDPAQAASANRAYRFGAGQAISYRADTSSANPAVSSITHAVKATAGDINGDGVSDFLIQRTVYEYSYDDDESENGDGYNNEIIAARAYQFALSDYRNGELTFTTITDNAPPLSEHELTRFVDVNADGLSDVIYWSLPHRQWQLQLSTGTGFTAATALVSATGGAMAEDQAVQFADINRDGYSDFLWLDEGQLKVKYWRASSQHYSDGHRLKYVGTGDKNSTIVMDYNGDGAADYVRFFGSGNGGRFGYASSGDEASGLWDAKRNVNHVVDRIQTGLGGITALHYEHLNQSEHYAPIEPAVSSCVWRCSDVVGNTYHNDHSVYNDPFGDIAADAHGLQAQPLAPVLALNGAIPVVSRVSSSAPTATDSAAQSSIAYYYAGGRIQAGGRGNLGFKQLRTVDQQTGVATTTTYRQDWPFIGKPSSTEVHSADAKLLSQATNRWALQGWQTQWIDTAKAQGTIALGALQPYVANSHEQGYALVNNGQQQGELLQSVTTELQYDAFGNALQILSRTEDGSGTEVQRQTTTNAYGSSDYDQRMGRLSATTVVTERAGQASPTRVSHFSYYQSGDLKGLLHTETLQPDAGAAQTLSTQHHYDANGNSTHTTTQGWDGQAVVTRPSSRIEYEASGRYVARSYQTYLNHGEVLTSQVVTRNAYGSATVAADTLGNRAYTYYSPMGRAYFTSSDAGGWQHTWLSQADSQCPGGSAYVSQTQGADGSHRQRCRDVLGRTTRSLSRGFDGQWLASDVHYDHLGRTVATSEAYKLAHGHSGYWTTIDNYDLLGRPTRITAPDGSVSQQQYQGLNTTHINALGHRKTETHNVLGELVAVRDNAGNSTHYQHDALGHLTQMTSSAGHITTLLYDALGRKTGMQDPDKGQWHYQHNAFGELIEQGDAKGQISRLQYDSLGRQQQRIDLNSDGSTAQSTQWHYDSQPNGIGQLAWVAHSDGYQQQQYYDNFGRNTRSDTTVPQAGTFSQRQTFDHLGRSYQQFDASSNQQANGQRGLQTHYNAYGYAYQVSDVRYQQGQPLTVYHRITQMDARGNVTASSLGNGVHTTHDYNIATGLLESINSLRLDGIVVQDLQYNWDSVGNLRHRIDHSGTKNLEEHFSYDGMNRLIAASVHSDNPYTQSLQYDALGNITEKSTVGYYHYGSGNTGTGTAGPHAVTKAGDTTYQYDANGNNISSSDGRRLAYSSFDKVILVSNGSHSTRFVYGPSRNRYLRSDSNSQSGSSKTTYYLGNVERIDYHSGPRAGEREYKRQLGVAIETLLYQHGELQQQTTHYLHHDHLGSIDLITDQLGQIIETLSFDPWGQRRHGGNWDALDHNALTAFSSAITTRGFTGHEMVDGVGIIHMNGRIYDPKLARFLQADPFIQAPTNSQSLNRYSYTINNPLNKTDPSGYFWNIVAYAVVAYVTADAIQTIGINSGWSSGILSALHTVNSLVSCYYGSVGECAAAVGGSTYGQTYDFEKALKAAAIAYASSEAYGAAGGVDNYWLNALTNGVVGGVMSVLGGGKFGHGFASAGLSALAKPSINKIGDGKASHKGLRVAARATLGGVISEQTGGKFANGAITAGFAQLYNAEVALEEAAQERQAELSKEFRSSIGEARRLGAAGDIDGYIDRVRSGGDWDYKSRIEYQNLEGIEDFGNFAFGATGAAWADGYTGSLSNQSPELTTNLLMRGAGAYQEFFQSYNPSDGHFYDLSPPASSNYGDQFRDQINIHTGAQYYFRRRAGE